MHVLTCALPNAAPVPSPCRWEAGITRNATMSTPHPVLVETAAGVRHVCDAVVVAMPLGVLQKHCDALFAPLLPPWKSTALRRLGVGSENKIIMRFEVGPTVPCAFGTARCVLLVEDAWGCQSCRFAHASADGALGGRPHSNGFGFNTRVSSHSNLPRSLRT